MALLSGPDCVITGSSTNPALRITQTGPGQAIRVEDITSPDSTPFVVNQTGNVGIGTDSPLRQLHITSNPPGEEANILLQRTTAAADEGIWRFYTNINDSFIISAFNDAFTSGQNAYILSRGTGATSGNHRLFVNNIERVRVASGGVTVGDVAGTGDPVRQLMVAGATEANIILRNNGEPVDERQYRFFVPSGSNNFVFSATSDDLSLSEQIWNVARGTGNAIEEQIFYAGGSSVIYVNDAGRVGLGLNNPLRQLHIAEDGASECNIILGATGSPVNEKNWRIFRTATDNFTISTFNDAGSAQVVGYSITRGTGCEIVEQAWSVGGNADGSVSSTRAASITSNRVFKIGGTIGSTSDAVGGLEIQNSATVPTTDPTNAGIIYVEGGALKYRGPGGTVTVIAPA